LPVRWLACGQELRGQRGSKLSKLPSGAQRGRCLLCPRRGGVAARVIRQPSMLGRVPARNLLDQSCFGARFPNSCAFVPTGGCVWVPEHKTKGATLPGAVERWRSKFVIVISLRRANDTRYVGRHANDFLVAVEIDGWWASTPACWYRSTKHNDPQLWFRALSDDGTLDVRFEWA
jgi:hypothetical protein